MLTGEDRTVNTVKMRAVAAAYEWVAAMVAALLVPVVLFSFFIRVVNVEGTSMKNTLMDQDKLVLFCYDMDYAYGDIVVVDRHTDSPLIKRVIAVGGDTVEITEDNAVYRNGKRLDEPYAVGVTEQHNMAGEMTVPEGCLFILGDNRWVSHDSRAQEVGFVSVDDVVGKVILRVWPLRSFGGVYGNLEQDS